MEVNIEEINRKHNIDLDPSILDKLTPVPDSLPDWKKNVVKVKNEKFIENAIQEAIANKDPYAGIPDWKKDILKKRDSEKAEMKQRMTEEERLKDQIQNQFKSKPEWKQDLITRRLSKDDSSK